MANLPIDLDILQKRQEIPMKIAKLSYQDEDKALYFMRMWGEKRIAISEIHEQLSAALKNSNSKFAMG